MKKLILLATVFLASNAMANECDDLTVQLNQCQSSLDSERQTNLAKQSEYDSLSLLLSNPRAELDEIQACEEDIISLEYDLEYLGVKPNRLGPDYNYRYFRPSEHFPRLVRDMEDLKDDYEFVSEKNADLSRKLRRKEQRSVLQYECIVTDDRFAGSGVGFSRESERDAIRNARANVHADLILKAPAAQKATIQGHQATIQRRIHKKGRNVLCFTTNVKHNDPLTQAKINQGPK